MNILPKKRWHVRTKENIVRVRKDEAEFNAKELEKKSKALFAEQEARVEFLRGRKGSFSKSTNEKSIVSSTTDLSYEKCNSEYLEEKKAEKEKKEKSIGLLTYLGQTVLDSKGEKPWYEVHPRNKNKRKMEADREEWETKKKLRADPLTDMKKIEQAFIHRKETKAQMEAKELLRANVCIKSMPSLFPNDISVPNSIEITKPDSLSSQSVVNKDQSIENTSKSESDSTSPAAQLNRLRAERLQREMKERERAALLMAKSMGLCEAYKDEEPTIIDERNLPFNSAFNPELSAASAEKRRKFHESRKRRTI